MSSLWCCAAARECVETRLLRQVAAVSASGGDSGSADGEEAAEEAARQSLEEARPLTWHGWSSLGGTQVGG